MLQLNGSDMKDFARQDVLNCYDESDSCGGGATNNVMQLLLRRGLELEQDEPYIGLVCFQGFRHSQLPVTRKKVEVLRKDGGSSL